MCQPELLRYLRIAAGSAGEDLAAETWVQVARKLVGFTGNETAFRAWLYTIARHRHIDWRRQLARRHELPVESEHLDRHPATEDPVAMVEAKMSTDAALALIASLPSDQAEAVMLRTVAQLPVAVVADIMGRPPGTVRVLCHRGLRRLARTLERPLSEPRPKAHVVA
jgi:RNA polymerase sigma-70 factor (ECF subfamily)